MPEYRVEYEKLKAFKVQCAHSTGLTQQKRLTCLLANKEYTFGIT